MTKTEAERLFSMALNVARARGVFDLEAIVTAETGALTRFANNTIHQNVAERTVQVSIRPVIDGRTARATTNRIDEAGIRSVVDDAIAITRLTEPDPDLLPLASPAPYRDIPRRCDSAANATPDERARAVAEAIHVVEAAGQIAAGAYSTGEGAFALFNSRGVSAWHSESHARFSITAMAPDSSGWAKASACDRDRIDPAGLARIAADKATKSAAPGEVPPGRYTVILEPAAVLDLAGQMFADFSATAIRDGRSFLTDRLGKKIFGDNITIQDDFAHPQQSGPAFDSEGTPKRTLTLVDRGVVREITYSRQAASLAGVEPTGHGLPLPNEFGEVPANIVFEGGGASVEQMIASTDRGILVTRLWYIREVDPYEKIFTGMTRDGTFLVEGGRITAGLRNFRFNQGLIEMLSNVETLSPAIRASGEESADMVVPAMKVRDFNFTEVTRF